MSQEYKIGTTVNLRLGNTDIVAKAVVLGHKTCDIFKSPIYLLKVKATDLVCRATVEINNHKYKNQAEMITTAAIKYDGSQKVKTLEEAVAALF